MAVSFQNAIFQLERLGLSDVLLPFLLVFTVVYAIMQKAQPLGEKKQFNVIVALVLALGVIIPHVLGYYPPNADIVNIINRALPNISVVLVAIVMVLLIVGLFGGKATWGSTASGWVALLAFVLVTYIFGRAAGWFQFLPPWLRWLDDPDTQALLIVIGVFALIIWFITKEEKKEPGLTKKVPDAFKELFGGK